MTTATFSPHPPLTTTDVTLLLHTTSVRFGEGLLLWDLAARIALQLDREALMALAGELIPRLTDEGALGPLDVFLDGVLRDGSADQRAAISPVTLLPLFASPHADIREAGLGFLSRLTCSLT